jgi:hypothetical protein
MKLPFPHYARRTGLLASAAALLSACNPVDSGSSNPGDTPDEFGFTPAYTEPKGTVHGGDFYPLTPGVQVPIAITFADTTQYSSLGMDMGTPIDESGTKSSSTTYTGRVETLPARRVTLPSGAYDLIPEVTALKEQTAGAVEYEDTTFYEKLAKAVNLRARASEGEAREEDADAVFLKRLPLTVGDTWAYGKTDSGITSSGRYYVTGMETITVGGKTLNAMRLDQMGKSKGTYHADGGATFVSFESEIHQVAWLAEGIGQVKQMWRSTTTSTRETDDNNTHVTLGQSNIRSMVMEMTGDPGPIR